ncbi:hypothetical protein [Mycolicibacterium frederiksbergense]|uniref:Uncharacterized protein n=1 Tax=Mycolicibacterium frederiksbergense TaxID=117567 RepID=A0A6H0RXR6_9MYCO|nr:hypothetical protein [Mycolicibacterium frederiksbergense]QIV79706.1 hypothetical protein EXE63_01375 [Mycolicibacterium frederiksbergense]
MSVAGALSFVNPGAAGAAHTVSNPVEENVASHREPASAAVAGAPPTRSGPVGATIAALEAQGFTVMLNRIGVAPLSECSVSSVRPGKKITEVQRNGRDLTFERKVYTEVQVDVDC